MTGMPIETLNDVLLELNMAPVENDKVISGLAIDSRKIMGGELFLAIPGIASDGRDYIFPAIKQGAAAVLVEACNDEEHLKRVFEEGVPIIPVVGLGERVGYLAKRYYSAAAANVNVVGVTGTNGKTSCCWFITQLLSAIEVPCALMGTLGRGQPGNLHSMLNTTSDVLSIYEFMTSLVEQDCLNLAMEVSSHGLEQGRVNGVSFEVGVFTNISRDHLDSYNSMDDYAEAKTMLFSDCDLKHAVINKDDPYSGLMLEACPDHVNVITWSQTNKEADVYASDIQLLQQGLAFNIHSPWGFYPVKTPLMGRFNIENLLTVIAALGVQGFDLSAIVSGIPKLTTVPGRMQRLGGQGKPLVIIDYAHTPDALGSVLNTLREHGAKRLICLFGCGGDRDRGKRPMMMSAAVAGADQVIVTSDNPRTEAPEAIIADALEGVQSDNKGRVTVVVNRAEAIADTVRQANADDIVVIAGKGHETYQEVNGIRYPFDDRDHASRALRLWGAA